MIAIIKLQMVSKITQNSKGPGAPPNERRRIINARDKLGICVTVLMAVSPWRCMRLYTNLMSSFSARIRRFGYFLLTATAQLISLVRHFPNLHCWRRSVSVREFTLVPDFVHLKLWLWVSLSFSTILLHSLIVHCGWMFNRAMQMHGIGLILLRGRGREYLCLTYPDTNFRSSFGWDVAPL
jgi:hypothetical protein